MAEYPDFHGDMCLNYVQNKDVISKCGCGTNCYCKKDCDCKKCGCLLCSPVQSCGCKWNQCECEFDVIKGVD